MTAWSLEDARNKLATTRREELGGKPAGHNPRAQGRAFVLGAGFTKAFVDDAPGMVDDFGGDQLRDAFRPYPRALDVLDGELRRQGDGRIDIERLLTRLDGGLPYDTGEGDADQLAFLFVAVKRALLTRLRKALAGQRDEVGLQKVAAHCLDKWVDVLTFNYDDALDQALFEVGGDVQAGGGWRPDGGYGFFCRSASMTISERIQIMDQTACRLLKLHGSINWRALLGAQARPALKEIVHLEPWVSLRGADFLSDDARQALIEHQLEPDPLIVLPVLNKSALAIQPVSKVVWTEARDRLAKATEVTFVGYSMPVTDLAAGYLFSETLSRAKPPIVKVIARGSDKKTLIARYQKVLPFLRDEQFVFRDARDWANELDVPS